MISKFSKLSAINAQLFREFGLNGILVNQIIKYLKYNSQNGWNISENIAEDFDVYSELRAHLLCCDHQNRTIGEDEQDEGVFFGKPILSSEHDIYYLSIVFQEVWLPAVKLYFRKIWDSGNESSLPGKLFITWKSILPSKIAQTYSAQFQSFFQENPQIMLDNYPHLVSSSMVQQVFQERVSYEIKKVLRKRGWHQDYQQFCETLIRWKRVLNKECFSNFILRALMPRLGGLVQLMEINPSLQEILPLQVLFHFVNKEIISKEQAFVILKNHFFNKWLIVLEKWTQQKVKIKGQIAKWFRGWRTYLCDTLGQDSHLVFYLRMGLFIIHKNMH